MIWFCALSMARAASGQPPGAPASQRQPVICASTRLVLVDVIIQDGKGQPVAGLTRDDCTMSLERSEQRWL